MGIEKRQITVRECMSAPVYSCEPSTPIADAYHLMAQHKIGRLPVVERESNVERTVGIVTLSDIQGARPPSASVATIYELNYYLAHLEVSQVMTHNPYTVRLDTPIEDAARLMLEQEIGGLPVVDEEERLAGIVSHSDLLRMFLKYWLSRASNDETSAERAEHSGQE